MNPSATRIYLKTPRETAFDAALTTVVSAFAEHCDVAALLVTGPDQGVLKARLSSVLEAAQSGDIAVVLDGDIELARQTDADGVHLVGGVEELTKARESLAQDKIIGISPQTGRHAAMEVAEAGADYLGFASFDMAEWWAPLFEVPCVAMTPTTPEDAKMLSSSGVEFVCPLDEVWKDAASAGLLAQRYAKALSAADEIS